MEHIKLVSLHVIYLMRQHVSTSKGRLLIASHTNYIY